MRIRHATASLHRQVVATPGWRLVTGPVTEVPCWLIKVEAQDGTTGWGAVEAMLPFTLPPAAIGACLDHLLPLLSGRNAFDIRPTMCALDRAAFGQLEIKAGIDCALHDLAARLLGVPLHRLLGGALHQSLPVARVVPLGTPEAMASFAGGLAHQGHLVLKLKADGTPEVDLARVRAVRARVGPSVRLLVDANGRYDAKTAIDTIARMDEHVIDLVEQPVPGQDIEGLALVTRAVRPLVEADETAVDLAAIQHLAARRAVDSISLRIPRLGGIAATITAAQLCQAAGIMARFGVCFLPSIFQATALHVAATLPGSPIGHEFAEHEMFEDDPFTTFTITDGKAKLPDGPGAGCTYRLTLPPDTTARQC